MGAVPAITSYGQLLPQGRLWRRKRIFKSVTSNPKMIWLQKELKRTCTFVCARVSLSSSIRHLHPAFFGTLQTH